MSLFVRVTLATLFFVFIFLLSEVRFFVFFGVAVNIFVACGLALSFVLFRLDYPAGLPYIFFPLYGLLAYLFWQSHLFELALVTVLLIAGFFFFHRVTGYVAIDLSCSLFFVVLVSWLVFSALNLSSFSFSAVIIEVFFSIVFSLIFYGVFLLVVPRRYVPYGSVPRLSF